MIPTTPPLPDSVPPLSLAEDAVQRLRSQILTLEGVLNDLRAQLVEAEDHLNPVTTEQVDSSTPSAMLAIQRQSTKNRMTFESSIDQIDLSEADKHTKSWALDAKEHKRYGRQLIMPEVGLAGGLGFVESIP